MKQKLWIFVFLVLNGFVSLNADDSYYPCRSYISFSYDDSNTLNNNNFKTQMNFIKNVVGTLNYPNRLRAEGGYTGEFNWNSGLSIAQMQNNIDNAQENPIPYSLSQQAASLLTSIEVLDNDYNDPIAALIFISDTSDIALKNADRWFAKLSGIHITFVLLGNNVDSLKLRNYASNFIFWPDLALPQPDNWDLLYYTAFGCVNGPIGPTSTKIQTTPTFSSTTTTSFPRSSTTILPHTLFTSSTIAPYLPCKTWISFGIDDSMTLTADEFSTETEFLSNIIGTFNYPQRIQVIGVSNGIIIQWNNYYPIKKIQTIVLGLTNYYGYSLRKQFSLLASQLTSYDPPLTNVATIIFISNTTDAALAGADQYFYFLTDVRITFVLLGSMVDSSKLTKYSNNFIYWTDLSQPQPDNWDSFSSSAYGCTTFTSPTTSYTSRPLPSTIAPYIPCKSWISFGIDDSLTLAQNEFNTETDFLSNIIGTFNYPQRIQVIGVSNGIIIQWNNYYPIKKIQTIVLGLTNYYEYSLRKQFSLLASQLTSYDPPLENVATIIFISNTTDAALAGADQYYNFLGGVRITFILLGANVDSSKLTKYSNNFIYWTDFSKPQPDNWDNLSFAAYGCDGKNML